MTQPTASVHIELNLTDIDALNPTALIESLINYFEANFTADQLRIAHIEVNIGWVKIKRPRKAKS